MGYGGLPNFTEYDASGHVLLDGTLGKNVQDFRTYLAPWSGHPRGAPSLAVAKGSGSLDRRTRAGTAPPRWRRWRVLAGPSSGSLAPLATAPRHGFETAITVSGAGPYVQVQALDSAGQRDRHLRGGQSLIPRALVLLASSAALVLGPAGRINRATRAPAVNAARAGAEPRAPRRCARAAAGPPVPPARSTAPRCWTARSPSRRCPVAATPPRRPRSASSVFRRRSYRG